MAALETSSPWHNDGPATSTFAPIGEPAVTDVLIVGAGLSGLMTAYYTLRDTESSVVLIDQGPIGCGASDNTAGQAVNGFEIGAAKLVKRFGMRRARAAYDATEKGRTLLRQLCAYEHFDCDLLSVPTIVTYGELAALVRDVRSREATSRAWGFQIQHVAADSIRKLVPADLAEHVRFASDKRVVDERWPADPDVIAYFRYEDSQLINVPKLLKQITERLCASCGDRFRIFAHSPLRELSESGTRAIARVGFSEVSAAKIVFATNGYRLDGLRSRVLSRMTPVTQAAIGYVHDGSLEPIAISRSGHRAFPAYANRRPFGPGSLIVVGQPKVTKPSTDSPGRDVRTLLHPAAVRRLTKSSMRARFVGASSKPIRGWGGLTAYTDSGLRVVGRDPYAEAVLHNWGCNGIGILLAVFGGWKIAQILRGDSEEEVFSPRF